MKKMNKIRQTILSRAIIQARPGVCSLFLTALCMPAFAMQPVSDADLSEVAAQDGISLIIDGKAKVATGQLQVNPDAGVAGVSATLEFAGISAAQPMIGAIGNNGVSTGGGPVSFATTIDLDNGATAGGTAGVSIGVQSSWNRMRFQTGNQLVYAGDAGSSTPTSGFGAMALDGPGSFSLTQQAGSFFGTPINMAANKLHLTLGGKQFDPTATVLANNPYGQFYYRQEAAGTGAELLLDKLYIDAGFTPGTGGMIGTCVSASACNPLSYGGFATGRSGIYIGTPHLDFNMTYAINMRTQPTGGGFRSDQGDVKGLAYWGWTGGFNNAELLISSGGMWSPSATVGARYNPAYPEDSGGGNTAALRNQGLNLSFQADFDSNFTWLVGQANGRAIIGFSDWAALDASTKGLRAPNISLDVINAGQGPGGLCWGGKAYGSLGSGVCGGTVATVNGPSTGWGNGALAPGSTKTNPGKFLNLAPSQTGIALAVRDLGLQAYSRKVTVYDDMNNNGLFTDTVGGIAETKTYDWALIYTLGQVDGNIYYYPGNTTSTAGVNGVTADVLFMSQSFYPNGSNGTNVLLGNTNFMIEDSTKQLGVGFVQSNLLFAAKRLEILLKTGTTGPLATDTGGIQLSSNDMRIELQGLLGGGSLPNLTQAQFEKMFYLDMNLQMSKFQALLYPDSSNGYPFLGYRARMTFGDTTVAPTNSTLGVPAAQDGTYISLAEPSNPNVDVRFSNITGDVNITGGRVFMISAGDSAAGTGNAQDKVRRLQIAQTMQVGTTVSGGAQLSAQVEFGQKQLGTINIPSGQIYSSIILKPQN